MRKSYKVGIALALGLTMSSSFMVQDEDSTTGWPFGLQIAQASAGSSASSLDTLHERTVALRQSTLLKRQRQALVSRVREELLLEAPRSRIKSPIVETLPDVTMPSSRQWWLCEQVSCTAANCGNCGQSAHCLNVGCDCVETTTSNRHMARSETMSRQRL